MGNSFVPFTPALVFTLCFAGRFSADTKVGQMTFYGQCTPRQVQCQNINSDKDRVVTLLDDGLQVMCDTKTDGGGWIIFQRRINGNVSFYRGWEDYKYGFGDYDVGEFYLGNEHICRLTKQHRYELRVEIKFQNKFYFSQYSQFQLLDESNNYMLKINGYSGNATDELKHSRDMAFSTFDKDNVRGCAKHWQSGWWFDSCFYVNLNGNWGSKEQQRGINWYGITTYRDSATFTEMKIRRIL
ncbi:hypothetical protein Btru_059385 [Bulinus truncatus]|nr:hypothetical protein Btru_059385 [Bulinus truncatus]